MTHFPLNGGRRSRSTPKTHHINTVNALISRYRNFICPFCGPASRNLRGYGGWHAARENRDRDYLTIFKALLNAQENAKTLCRHLCSKGADGYAKLAASGGIELFAVGTKPGTRDIYWMSPFRPATVHPALTRRGRFDRASRPSQRVYRRQEAPRCYSAWAHIAFAVLSPPRDSVRRADETDKRSARSARVVPFGATIPHPTDQRDRDVPSDPERSDTQPWQPAV